MKIFKKPPKKNGGMCLSTVYKGMRSKYDWKCKKGHIWSATGDSVLNQPSWCPTCVGKFIPKSDRLEEIKDIARQRGGELVSGEFINCESKMCFKCVRGHLFFASLDKIKHQNSWCPKCRFFRSEEICRRIFEISFNRPFEKCRPEWLRNKNGVKLELDGYNQDLCLAFEYQGESHLFEDTDFFHKTRSFKNQIENDKLKPKLCIQNGVKLINITPSKTLRGLTKQIKDKLNSFGIIPPKCPTIIHTREIKIHYDPALKRLAKLASKRNLLLISDLYIGVFEKHNFLCNICKNQFSLTPDKLRSGRWCPICSKKIAHNKMRCSYNEIKQLAKDKNGILLSKTYKNDRTKMEWKCNKGHIWSASAGNIKRGSWCPVCAGQPWQIDKEIFFDKMLSFFKDLANQKGGVCLSDRYINAHFKLRWKCHDGHEWESSPNNVKRGTWCPFCRYKKNTETMRSKK